MKTYDKNSLIGLILMAIILIVFNTFFFPEIAKEESIKKSNNISTEDIYKSNNRGENNTINDQYVNNAINEDSVNKELNETYGVFANAALGEETFHTIENDKKKITVSNKGGRITSVIMKEYQTYDTLDLDLFDADSSYFNLQFTTGKIINTSSLFFIANEREKSLNLKAKASENNYIEFIYTITDDYLIDFDINLVGMETLIPIGVNYMNLEWQMKTPQTEKSKTNQDMYTGIQYQYSSDNEVDYLSFSSTDDDEINARLNWVAFKQQFFSSIFIAKEGFEKPTNLRSTKSESSKFIKDLYANFELPYKHKNNERLSFQFYFGPNHYKTLESYNYGFEELIPLGWGIFGWVNDCLLYTSPSPRD